MNTNAEIWAILGIILFMTYYTAYNKSNEVDLWVGIKNYTVIYYIYICSLVLSFFMGIWLVIWSIVREEESKEIEDGCESNKFLTLGILFLVGFSIGWVPMSLAGNKKLTLLSLAGATAGAGMIFSETIKDSEFNSYWMPVIPASVILFQTGFLDLVVWNLFYFGFLK